MSVILTDLPPPNLPLVAKNLQELMAESVMNAACMKSTKVGFGERILKECGLNLSISDSYKL